MFAGGVGNALKFRFNNKTIVQANYQTLLTRLFPGYRFIDKETNSKKLRYELFGYTGLRIHFNKINSDLDGPINRLDVNPVWSEPLIGIQNQITLKNWFFILQADYGGFHIKNKYSSMINALCFYRLSKLLSIKTGWTDWDLNHNWIFRSQNLKIKVHLSGPTVGIAFHF